MIATQRATRALAFQRVGSAIATTTRQASSKTCHLRFPAVQQLPLPGQQSKEESQAKRQYFSTTPISQIDIPDKSVLNLGTVTRSLSQLDVSLVKMIEAELKDVDTNKDGR
jgi:type II secretory pathway pseudopilin PulG